MNRKTNDSWMLLRILAVVVLAGLVFLGILLSMPSQVGNAMNGWSGLTNAFGGQQANPQSISPAPTAFLPIVMLDSTGATPTSTSTATATATATTVFTCSGENYDVNDNAGDGCEQADVPTGNHTQTDAISLGSQDCTDSNTGSFSGRLLSDRRTHTLPPVTGFNSTTGAAPDYYKVLATGGFLCINEIYVTVQTTGGGGATCYRFTVIVNSNTYATNFTGNGSVTLSGISYLDNTTIYFKLEKTCSTSTIEAVDYTVTFHL